MAANISGQEQMAVDLSEDEKKLEMALERSKQEQEPKVVMADEELAFDLSENGKNFTSCKLSADEFRTSNPFLKRGHGDSTSETALVSSNLSTSPSKRQKTNDNGEQKLQNFVTNGEDLNVEATVRDVGGGATYSGPYGKVEEMITDRDEGGSVGVRIGSPKPEQEGSILVETRPISSSAGATENGEERREDECRRKIISEKNALSEHADEDSVNPFSTLPTLNGTRSRVPSPDTTEHGGIVATEIGEQGLDDECPPKGMSDAQLPGSEAAPIDISDEDSHDDEDCDNDEDCDDDEDREVDEDSGDDEDSEVDEDSEDDEDIDDDEDSNNAEDNVNPRAMVAASVVQRQQNDPELKEKVHKLEIDFWANRISRDHYNNERFKLYTKEEAKAGRIVWPNSFMHSPAGHREGQHESWSLWDDGDELFDELDRIETKFEDDPEAKAAEYKRWEKIRKLEEKYYHNRTSRDKYNKRRIALYTEAERNKDNIRWPGGPTETCYSPAGYREDILPRFRCTSYKVDLQKRLQFHYPFYLSNPGEAKDLCELCVPLIEEHRREREGQAKRMLAESVKRQEEQEKKRAAKIIPCSACSKKFSSERGRRDHSKAMHPDLLQRQELAQKTTGH
ncbi:unnamed protein product [Calypogeia fissa]